MEFPGAFMAGITRVGILLGLVGGAFMGFFLIVAPSIPSTIQPVITVLGLPGAVVVYILETLKVNITQTTESVLKIVVWVLLCIGISLVADR